MVIFKLCSKEPQGARYPQVVGMWGETLERTSAALCSLALPRASLIYMLQRKCAG